MAEGTIPNTDSRQDTSVGTHHFVSGSRHRLQELSKWLNGFTDKYVERKYTELSPKGPVQLLHMSGDFAKQQQPRKDSDGGYSRVIKSQLSRMPMSFGKRGGLSGVFVEKLPDGDRQSKTEGLPTLVIKFNDGVLGETDDFTRIPKGKLGRMPMAYGKRSGESIANDDVLHKSNTLEMPSKFAFEYRYALADAFRREAKGRLGRMPMAFGKRENHEAPYNHDKSSFVGAHDNVLGIPHLNLDRSTQDEKYYPLFGDIVLTKLPEDMAPAGSEEVADEEPTTYARDSRGSLNRMPMSFGKRAIHDKMAATNTAASENVADHISRRSTTVEKRDPYKHKMVFEMLGRKINSLKRDIEDTEHGKIKTLLNQFLERGNSLTRLTRSKLERMPLTYGKRRHGHSGDEGSSSKVYRRVIRPKLERMPLTYGKRMAYPLDLNTYSTMHPLSDGVHREGDGDSREERSGSGVSEIEAAENLPQAVGVSRALACEYMFVSVSS